MGKRNTVVHAHNYFTRNCLISLNIQSHCSYKRLQSTAMKVSQLKDIYIRQLDLHSSKYFYLNIPSCRIFNNFGTSEK